MGACANEPVTCKLLSLVLFAACITLVSCFVYFSILKIGLTCFSELSFDYQQTTWCHIQEDKNTS
jgi:hypothetical protein